MIKIELLKYNISIFRHKTKPLSTYQSSVTKPSLFETVLTCNKNKKITLGNIFVVVYFVTGLIINTLPILWTAQELHPSGIIGIKADHRLQRTKISIRCVEALLLSNVRDAFIHTHSIVTIWGCVIEKCVDVLKIYFFFKVKHIF